MWILYFRLVWYLFTSLISHFCCCLSRYKWIFVIDLIQCGKKYFCWLSRYKWIFLWQIWLNFGTSLYVVWLNTNDKSDSIWAKIFLLFEQTQMSSLRAGKPMAGRSLNGLNITATHSHRKSLYNHHHSLSSSPMKSGTCDMIINDSLFCVGLCYLFGKF